ncbi:MAG: antibiotic biosynthesis monooxygenase [Nocardioides sp.]
MAEPVTVAITRQLEVGHEAEMVSWLNAGIHLAERFPGFLGAGWVRPEADSTEWHMLYRFADHDALLQWEQSSQRAWWRASASGLGVVEARVEKRTGIEGWFDAPESTLVVESSGARAATPAPPPRWKQACTIFLVFFPLSLVVNVLAREYLRGLVLPLRVLVIVLVMTPIMTYVALPWITRSMQWWLQGQPAPWRRSSRESATS